jgi:hypothetical protein
MTTEITSGQDPAGGSVGAVTESPTTSVTLLPDS